MMIMDGVLYKYNYNDKYQYLNTGSDISRLPHHESDDIRDVWGERTDSDG